jgi:(p)ppGpp synthase/HD superfamily hydrolase
VTELTERFSEALILAARLHAGQYRKGKSVPYVGHLLAVASLVLELTEHMANIAGDVPDVMTTCSDTTDTPYRSE